MNKRILSLLLLLSLTSCFKSAEQITREKQVDTSMQMVASLTAEVNALKEKLSMTTGQIEEMGHGQAQKSEQEQTTNQQTFEKLTEQIKNLIDKNKKQDRSIYALKRDMKKQKAFIKKVTSALQKMSKKKSTK